MSAEASQADGGSDSDRRSVENIVKNLGGYGINAEIIGHEEVAVVESPDVPINMRREGMEFLESQGFGRDEEKTRARENGAVYRRDSGPRQEVDLYGEPVIEWSTDHEYWEGYVPANGDHSDNKDRLMIAKYVWEGGEWVKTGLERAHITDIHREAYSRRKGGE